MSEKIFAEGLYFDRRDNAPDFVAGRVSIAVDRFTSWLIDQERSEKGYVNIQILRKRDGSGYYAALDDWKPSPDRAGGSQRRAEAHGDPEFGDDIPF